MSTEVRHSEGKAIALSTLETQASTKCTRVPSNVLREGSVIRKDRMGAGEAKCMAEWAI